jgi:hypothetical protein
MMIFLWVQDTAVDGTTAAWAPAVRAAEVDTVAAAAAAAAAAVADTTETEEVSGISKVIPTSE